MILFPGCGCCGGGGGGEFCGCTETVDRAAKYIVESATVSLHGDASQYADCTAAELEAMINSEWEMPFKAISQTATPNDTAEWEIDNLLPILDPGWPGLKEGQIKIICRAGPSDAFLHANEIVPHDCLKNAFFYPDGATATEAEPIQLYYFIETDDANFTSSKACDVAAGNKVTFANTLTQGPFWGVWRTLPTSPFPNLIYTKTIAYADVVSAIQLVANPLP